MKKFVKAFAVVITTLTVASCSANGGAPTTAPTSEQEGTADTERMVVSFISHGAPGDTYWDLVLKGAQDAAKKDNIELRYSSDPQAPNQANLVQNAIDSKVDGIAVTVPNAQAIGPTAQKAVEAGIPVVGLNAGMDVYKDYGMSAFFGQDEHIAGEAVGDKLKEAGAEHVLCVIHEQGNSSQEARCGGVAKTAGAEVENIYVNGQDLTSVQSTLEAKLQQDSSIDWIMALQAPVAMRAVAVAGDSTKVATFDTNAELVDAIAAGDVEFAVDQQPYVQGYMAVDALWLAHRNGSTVGGGTPVYTGPSFVDASNVEGIAEAAKAGLR